MASDSLDELLELQRQLTRMQEAQAAEQQPEPQDDGPADMEAWLQDVDGETLVMRLREEVAEWLDGLDADLKDTKPSTVLLLLGLGVLAGRMSK